MPSRSISCIIVLFASSFMVAADIPLHQRIDRAIESHPVFPKNSVETADDAEFLRRIFLDLTGKIPTSVEARAFLKDSNPDKRVQLIDKLLASPEHYRHMAAVLDVMLIERRPDRQVKTAVWREFLRKAVEENRPWDVLVREILEADPSNENQRTASKFFLERNGEPHLIVKDLSRLFLGMNLQCAQCHDHPRIDDYKQDMYYGLFAFVNRTTIVTDPATKLVLLSEKADGEATFQSVFDPAKLTKTSLPRVLNGSPIKDPPVVKGKEYIVPPPVKGVARSVPQYSRRSQLGAALANANNPAFARNIANRLWAHMMGRGLVHPLDLTHGDNPPSHPELLEILEKEMVQRKFDMRGFLRELALSKTYQRSSKAPTANPHPASYAFAILKPQSPEQLAWSLMQATGLIDSARLELGTRFNESALYAKFQGNVAPFVTAFGSEAGTAETFDATLDQALFLANGTLVRSWLKPVNGNLMDRLLKLTDIQAVADELVLSIYTRFPTDEERKDIVDFLGSRNGDRAKALDELIWALLTSNEFRFNH